VLNLSDIIFLQTAPHTQLVCVKTRSQPLNIFRENRRALVHSRKTQLDQLAFEQGLTKELSGEWKDKVLQKFSATARTLQLF